MDTARPAQHRKTPMLARSTIHQGGNRRLGGGILIALMLHVAIVGCVTSKKSVSGTSNGNGSMNSMAPSYLEIESPKLCDQALESTEEFAAGPPPTIRNFQKLEPWQLTLEEAVQLTLSNAQVLNRLGGRVVLGPQGVATIYDPAIQATNPLNSAEAALSAFDAQYLGVLNHGHDEQFVNNPFFGTNEKFKLAVLMRQADQVEKDLEARTATA